MHAVIKQPQPLREEFADLAREHHRELLVYARALTREQDQCGDLVQDAFVTAWENLGKFDITKDFGSWMRGIIRNKWREQIRRNKRLVALDDGVLEEMEAEMRVWQQLRQDGGAGVFVQLERCMDKLPEGMQDAVKTFYYEGRNSDEAAEKLQINSSTLRKRLERAREVLRGCISNH